MKTQKIQNPKTLHKKSTKWFNKKKNYQNEKKNTKKII